MRQSMFFPKQRVRRIRASLLQWYARHRRDLPWRRTSNPYQIWISEIMAQQTRIETVIPYYERFVTRFPTVEKLARAREESVLKLWEGLGYYSRARNLHAAAKEVCEAYGGKLPQQAAELKKLKGFGPYTSASVASIAFGEPIACVDGNVKRVLSRMLASNDPVDEAAQVLVDPDDPSSFNQGLMELGARICIPRKPKCGECPLAADCQALAKQEVELFPAKKAKAKLVIRNLAIFVLQRQEKTLFLKRSSEGLWGGLWELPNLDVPVKPKPKELVSGFEKEFGLKLVKPKIVGNFTHILSHQKIQVTVYESPGTGKGTPKETHWLTQKEIEKRPLSRLQQKALACASPR